MKGFTPEAHEVLTALPEGRIAGDRVLGFRFADSRAPDAAWSRSMSSSRSRTPWSRTSDSGSITRRSGCVSASTGPFSSKTRSTPAAQTHRRHHPGLRARLGKNPPRDHPETCPRLVGNSVQPRYQDNEAGQITLHSRENLAAVAAAVGDPALDGLRFR